MIVQLKKNITRTHKSRILQKLREFDLTPCEVNTQEKNYLVIPIKNNIDLRELGCLTGVADIHRVKAPNKLVSRKWKTKPSIIDLGNNVLLGEEHFQIIAGPCSIENRGQIEKVADKLVELNIRIMRGGVFKPRSSPYSFRGLGMEGLKEFYTICQERGIKIITEVMEVNQIEKMYPYVDIFQVGSRNSQNFNLLEALGKTDKPVMIKRGISGTIAELLASAEYVFSCGNEKLILCERGIRTYEKSYRNTFDLNAVPVLKEKSHLPVIADPSHAMGIRRFIEPMALAATVCGADGVMMEAHPAPESALSDGNQSLRLDELEKTVTKIKKIKKLMRQL